MSNFKRLGSMLACLMLTIQASASTKGSVSREAELMLELRTVVQDLEEATREMTQPQPPGEIKILKAVVIAVTGRAQWRASDESPWKQAKVDDLLEPGARMRTGGRSSMMLRVGLNATLKVGARTRATLPQIAQIGEVLTTTAGVSRGRLDFKVDRVGLTNDFKVITPSMTLAVRGTGGAVRFGGLKGIEFVGADFNEMNAVEIRYFLTQLVYYLSGNAKSTSSNENPVWAALFDSIGPPAIFLLALGDEALLDRLSSGLLGEEDFQDIRRVESSVSSGMNTMNEIEKKRSGSNNGDPPPPPPPDNSAAFLVMSLCADTNTDLFFSNFYLQRLLNDFGSSTDVNGLTSTQQFVESICFDFEVGEISADNAFTQILVEVNRYCQGYSKLGPSQQELCVQGFLESLSMFANMPPSVQ